jgi:hypothetical protein
MNDLRAIAHKAMTDRGLEPDFPPDAIGQLNGIQGAARETDHDIRDLRTLLWCSIDNDTSNVDVADQIKVQLTSLNIEPGFIDFARSGNAKKKIEGMESFPCPRS